MTDLTTTGTNLPAAPSGAWGSEGASTSDILIPRIQLMHDISKLVKDGKAKAGQLIHSTSQEVLGDSQKPVEIIPLTTYRDWIINDVDEKGRDKFRTRLHMTPDNEHLPKEGVENGKPIRRVYCINFFVLVAGRPSELPFLLTFKKTSLMPGKKLSTHFQMSAMKKQPPAHQVFKLGSALSSYEGFTFHVLTLEPSRIATPDELALAYNWYQTLNASQVKIDEGFGADEVPFN